MVWDKAVNAIKELEVVSSSTNELVLIKGHSEKLECIGVGTDAAVFRLLDEPEYAFKVYSKEKLEKMEFEKQVYMKLGQSEFFPIFYKADQNVLMISYEKGITLYDCLVKGIYIPLTAIEDVERARRYAFEKGLNPRDIHLKNILLHEGRAKLIDVSEYMKEGDDQRWGYLKEGYLQYYHLIEGREVPIWILETVKKWYRQQQKGTCNFQDFIDKIMILLKNKRNSQ
ncbi:serine/threonine protein kinase [Alkalihalobacillus sp. MEB130]|uniref:serine/threonine protein kinase n=1 Tax=Alkalihalobacillus sp. MEB130 TaxID=2976704 RepID=UPI0028DF915C|nr:serine/threonine protein kinase [Alkalihalobacillus sp. MEB130]MDT8862884.1 serine/threonine protein kinase [Alkalihalobacillus sp. MEB130]